MEQQHSKISPRFLISGGGTGGHIFPAVAIADEIKRRVPSAEFLFVGAKGKMEMKKVPEAGYRIECLNIAGISRSSMLANLKLPFKLISSLWQARKLVKDFKPTASIGTGGYASGPALMVSSNLGVPTFIQEQNAFAGVTNKKLAKKAKGIYTAYEGMEAFFPKEKITITGNPVRVAMFENMPTQKEAKKKLGLAEDKLVVLSVGGSLGSRSINNFWTDNATKIAEKEIQVLWQTGAMDYKSIVAKQELKNKNIHITEFINDMSMAYAAADIIVSRAGAIAISELCLVGKPVILVPYPYAAEDHQSKNADGLATKNAAIKVEDKEIKEKLLAEIEKLLADEKLREELAKNIKAMGKPNATTDIVNSILEKLDLV